MLFATFQPQFRTLDCNLFSPSKMLPGVYTQLVAAKAQKVNTYEETFGFDAMWAMPARSLQELLTNDLLVAANYPDYLFFVDTDDFIRIDKAKWYQSIADDHALYNLEDCIDEDCPDWNSEFIISSETLKNAKCACQIAYFNKHISMGAGVPFWYAKDGEICHDIIFGEEFRAKHAHLFNLAWGTTVGARACGADGSSVGSEEMFLIDRMQYMAMAMPFAWQKGILGNEVYNPIVLEDMAGQHTSRIADMNAMGMWSQNPADSKALKFLYDKAWSDTVIAPYALLDVVVDEKPGRNDVCPCGSGKKFKKCCGR